MLGTLNPNSKKAVVVGAGISGLLIAERLLTLGYDVEIFEASARVGGLIQSRKTPLGLTESAAHSLMMTDELKAEFQRLGVELLSVDPKSRARFIYRKGKNRRLPLGFLELIHTLRNAFSRPKNFPVLPAPQSEHHSFTLEQWGNAFLGKPATEFLLSPFVTGIFACTPKELEVELAFPTLPRSPEFSLIRSFRNQKKNGKKQKTEMMVPRDGMESLVQALARRLEGRIHLNHPVHEIESFQNSNVILTTPSKITAQFLKTRDPTSAQALEKISYAPLITCTAFFKSSAFPKVPRGVGVLSPRNQGLRILGILFNSSAFPNRTTDSSLHSYTIMLGGTTDPGALDLTDDQIHAIIAEDLPKVLANTQAPQSIEITRWKNAIPIYNFALRQARESLNQGWCSTPGHIIFSNYSKEVSIRGMMQSLPQ